VRKVLTVVGARPQFVKAAILGRRLRERFVEVLVHTGQHYDPALSAEFLAGIGMSDPDEHLGVGSHDREEQIRRMRGALGPVLAREAPDLVVVHGDTNSTLAGALAAEDAGIPLAHVEAGLRAGRPEMVEEKNRIGTDRRSALRFAPTERSMAHLRAEGLAEGSVLVGDVMLEACRAALDRAPPPEAREYYLATVHRAETTDDPARLRGVFDGLARLDRPVALPLHPRTEKALRAAGIRPGGAIEARPPVGHAEAMGLLRGARAVLTDSGGLQKEAFFLGVPCVTLREETEWTETVEAGWNRLAGTDPDEIASAAREAMPLPEGPDLEIFGGGRACARVSAEIDRFLGRR